MKIYVAGHTGLVGSALLRALAEKGEKDILVQTRAELDLLDQQAVLKFLRKERPDQIYLAAGKTGGVYANDMYRAEFLHENIVIQGNVIHAAYLSEVKKLLYFGCSSMYPKHSPQPVKEEHLLSGPLEPTNEPFAIAKIAGVKLCESYRHQYGCDFISAIPTNLYGPNQDYTPLSSLIIPALIRRFHEAKCENLEHVRVWGSGKPSRDFLFVDDLANAALFLMERYSDIDPINIGTGIDITIRDTAEIIRRVVGFSGTIEFDSSKPDGVLAKLQDITKLSVLGWQARTRFEDGIRATYEDFLRNGLG